jgi:hypothetical protein
MSSDKTRRKCRSWIEEDVRWIVVVEDRVTKSCRQFNRRKGRRKAPDSGQAIPKTFFTLLPASRPRFICSFCVNNLRNPSHGARSYPHLRGLLDLPPYSSTLLPDPPDPAAALAPQQIYYPKSTINNRQSLGHSSAYGQAWVHVLIPQLSLSLITPTNRQSRIPASIVFFVSRESPLSTCMLLRAFCASSACTATARWTQACQQSSLFLHCTRPAFRPHFASPMPTSAPRNLPS